MLIYRNPVAQEMGEIYQLCWDVLRNPGEPMDGTERDEYDDMSTHPETIHGAVTENGRIISTGRIHQLAESSRDWQVRYMATLPEYRNKGIGAMMLGQMEKQLRASAQSPRPEWIHANARVDALSLYRRAGYVVLGDEFELVGIPHVKIAKRVHGGIW